MQYLVFDIECCDGHHICEFGYVLADERFRVKERSVITIDPEKPFALGDEIRLHFSEEEYRRSPRFPVFYERIRALLRAEGQVVVGHSVSNDAAFLRTACRRYHLPPINFEFMDTQRLYRVATGTSDVALEKVGEALSLPPPAHLHRSDDDALLTLRVLAALSRRMGKTPEALKEEYVSISGKSEGYEISYREQSLAEVIGILDTHPEQLGNKRRRLSVTQYAEAWPPCAEPVPSPLAGKALCFSARFEEEHTALAMRLVRLLAERGCRYHTLAAEIDYIVVDAAEAAGEVPCPRLACVRSAGRSTEVIDLAALYALLGMSEAEVAAIPLAMPAPKKKSPRGGLYYSTAKGSGGTTIGDLFLARGIDPAKFG